MTRGETMEEQQNDDYIRFRIPSKTKKLFKAKCKAKAINFSEWLRQQVEKFIKGER